jgi:RHS repeat-associated protein
MTKVSGVSPFAVTLPQGGGDVRGLGGSFVVDYNRGTGSYQIDLQIPKGFARFTPGLILSYNTGSPNGIFGMGWSLSVGAISRDGENGFVSYDEHDKFILDEHGELTKIPDGSYRPKVDRLFARISYDSHQGWEIRSTDGTIQRYGIDETCRIFDPADHSRVLSWVLQEFEDANGNKISYKYERNGNNLYLREINYAIYQIIFIYESRQDRYSTGRHGFLIETNLRCKHIEIHCSRLGPNTLIRSYAFEYTQPLETSLSLLEKITYSGHRFVEGVEKIDSLPSMTFSYSAFDVTTARLKPFESEYNNPPPMLGSLLGLELLDFTSEGLPDVVQIDGTQNRYWRNRGDGTWDPPKRIGEIPSDVHLYSAGVTFGDQDGSCTADLLVSSGTRRGYYPNLGHEKWGVFVLYDQIPNFEINDPNTRQLDLNLDGIIDVIKSGQNNFVLYLNKNGNDWQTPMVIPKIRDMERFPDVFFSDSHVHLADMNGDGLADIVLVYSGSVWYWACEGLGRWSERKMMNSPPALPRRSDPKRLFLTDINGDGLADIVYVDLDSVTVWINQHGEMFSEPLKVEFTPLLSGAQVRLCDMMGTGTRGILWTYPYSSQYRKNYKYLDFTDGIKPYLLNYIDNGLGKITEITYRPSTHFATNDRNNGRTWRTFLPFPVQVVAEIRQTDTTAKYTSHTEIRYHEGMYDAKKRRFVGFGEVELIEHGDDSVPGLLTNMKFDQTVINEMNEERQAMATAVWGRLIETTQQELGSRRVLRRAVNTWEATLADRAIDGSGIIVTHRKQNRVEIYGGDEGPLIVSHTFRFDEHGNVTQDMFEANGPSPLVKITNISYAKMSDGTIGSAPSSVVEMTEDGTITREIKTYYDGDPFIGLPLGQATKGNAVKMSMLVSSDRDFDSHYGTHGLSAESLGYKRQDGYIWVDITRYSYDDKGNFVVAKNALGHEVKIAYDSEGLFPVELTNAAGQTNFFKWNYESLQPKEIVDSNGNYTRFLFDSIGRVTEMYLPGDQEGKPSEKVAYHLESLPPYVDLTKRVSTNSEKEGSRRIFYNGDGQVIQQRTEHDENIVVSPLLRYNNRGWLTKQGRAAFSSSMEYGEGPADIVSKLHYDALGQLIRVTYADGRFDRTDYFPFRTVHYDRNDTDDSPDNVARGFFDTPKIHRYDGWGRIVSVTELHDDINTTHQYRYDANGRLVEVIAPDGKQILSQVFDLVGNLLRVDHLDIGQRNFFYNGNGEGVLVIDNEGNRIERHYDSLSRPTRTLVNGVIIQSFLYDDNSRSNQIGRLGQASDESGNWLFDYDEQGRVTGRALSSEGKTWRFEYGYNSFGGLDKIRYPDGSEVLYEYDRAGLLVKIPNYVQDIQHDPRGRRTSILFANEVRMNFEFDMMNSFLKSRQIVGPGGVPFVDYAYERDNVGNPLHLIDRRTPGSFELSDHHFEYDGRYRLIKVTGICPLTGDNIYTREYSYDDGGNFTKHPSFGKDVIWYDPLGSNKIAGVMTDGIKSRLFEHDNNGNLKIMPNRNLEFDALGRLSKVRNLDGREVTFLYNVTGERIWRVSSDGDMSQKKLFLGGLYEEDETGEIRKYIIDPQGPLSLEDNNNRIFLHNSELGHLELVTDNTGSLIGQKLYHPFGEPRSASGNLPGIGFGSKTFDDATGFYYFGARHYSPEIGRFISPDPLLIMDSRHGITNPQLYNLYSYAANNPMVYVDPYGLSLLGAVLGGLVGAMAGAIVFVATGGNILAAGVVGGFVGGAVSGAVDGGVRGAIIGGLVGAASGLLGAGVAWGVSALGGLIGGYVGQQVATMIMNGAVLGSALVYGLNMGISSGNWEFLAGFAAGMVGGAIGNYIGNRIMMRGVYNNINNSPRVRQTQREVQDALNNQANFENVQYHIEADTTKNRLAFQSEGNITFNEPNLGNDYLEFRETHAHELYHEFQSQTIPDWPTAWKNEAAIHGTGMDNIYQIQAENFGQRFMNYIPYPYGSYTKVIAPFILSLSYSESKS